MRIQSININGFGLFRDFNINDLAPGLNLITGENEAGKSTCLEFIRTCLFGAPVGKGSRLRTRPPVPSGSKGGGEMRLALENGDIWELFWQPRTGAGLHTLFRVENNSSTQLNIEEYRRLIGDTSRELFESVYGFSLEQLQDLNSLKSDGRVADLLYGAGLGLGNISLPQILSELKEKQMEEIWRERGQKPALNILLNQLNELDQNISEKQKNQGRYALVQNELAALAAESRCHEENVQAGMADVQTLKELIQLKARLTEQEKLQSEYSAALSRPVSPQAALLFSEVSLENIIEHERRKNELQAKLNHLGEEQARLIETLAASSPAQAISAFKSEIDSLQEQKSRYQHLLEEKKEIFNKIEDTANYPPIRGLLQNKICSSEIEETIIRLQTAWQNLSALLPALSLLQAEDNDENEFKRNYLRMANPAALILMLGAAAAAATGAYSHFQESSWSWLIWIILALLSGALLKAAAHSRKRARLAGQDKLSRQLAELIARAAPSVQELKGLLAGLSINIPETDAPLSVWAETLAEIEAKTAELEHSLSLIEKLPSLLNRHQEIENKIHQLDQLAKTLLRKTEAFIPAPEKRNMETAGFPEILRLLTMLANNAIARQMHDEKLKGLLEGLAAQQQETSALLENAKAESARRFALTTAGSLEDLKALHQNWCNQIRLEEKISAGLKEIESLAGRLPEAERVLQKLIPQGEDKEGSLIERLNAIAPERLQTMLDEQNQLLAQNLEKGRALASQSGSLEQEANSLLSESELATLVLERENLREQAASLARRWSVAALVRHFMEKAKQNYEAEHQTAVMRKASRIFSEITAQAYRGLDPTDSENNFAVLTHAGEIRLPQELSRGAREQLYLALRLAVIEHRAETSEPLPIILDDALVNFDPVRLGRAINAILALATKHQIFYFTCQPHIIPEFTARAEQLGIIGKQYVLNKGMIS
ncbi:MAG: AAA family ATPase [Desulfovibrionaceae bacterium]|nr:AAA family ATPase [Desulfovibrionaceae bacterium]